MTNQASRSIVRPEASVVEPIVIGDSAAMRRTRWAAARAAGGSAKVLITGESRVGKDLVGRLVHTRSARARQPFMAINCAGLSEMLLESELFGHVRGSFTDAVRDKIGKLQHAHRGTVFLDEIGEMSLRMQALLLRFLENGEIQPVGSDGPNACVDVRVVAATNRNLPEMVAAGRFREDLMYRIMVVHIDVPPLRDRPEDVRPLVRHTIGRLGSRLVIGDEAMHVLERYRWPGNVRQLQNVIEQLVCMSPDGPVAIDDLPPALVAAASGRLQPAKDRRRQLADELFQALMAGTCTFWNDVHTQFVAHDLTRHDIRELVRRGLAATSGNYRAMLGLFGMSPRDYKRFLSFLATHDCRLDFREFRVAVRPQPARPDGRWSSQPARDAAGY
jgi:transcriptional regulator with PAS, ATPase and Fis domain